MYKNIGKKIKTLATVICWIGIIVSIIAAIASIIVAIASGIDEEYLIITIIAALAGGALMCFLFWISGFMLYGYGEMIDQSTETAQNTKTLIYIFRNFMEHQQTANESAANDRKAVREQLHQCPMSCPISKEEASAPEAIAEETHVAEPAPEEEAQASESAPAPSPEAPAAEPTPETITDKAKVSEPAPAPAKRFCMQCGTAAEAGTAFCRNCGAKIND